MLKAIRKHIANLNAIDYEPTPCRHAGDCLGTCPMCDKEVSWLMKELQNMSERGESVIFENVEKEELEHIILEGIDATFSENSDIYEVVVGNCQVFEEPNSDNK